MKASTKAPKKRQPGITAEPSVRRKIGTGVELLPPAVVVLVTAVVFGATLPSDFVNWDDSKNFLENPHYRGFGWTHLLWMFTTFHMGHYQPLSWMTLGLDYVIWGMKPFGYHLTNLLLHLANALLFYVLALRVFSLPAFAAVFKLRSAMPAAAAFAALLFSIHPLRVESVAWVTERRDVLAGFFLLLTVLYYLKAVTDGQSPSRYRGRMTISLAAYLLSLLSKASGMTLPVVLLVLDVYPLRRVGANWKDWFSAGARKLWLEKLCFLLLGAATAAIAFAAQYQSAAYRPLEQHDFLSRNVQVFYSLVFYLRKTLFPVGLSPLYELPLNPQDWYATYVLSGFVVIVITLGLFLLRVRWPALLAAWIVYGALLAPTSGVAQSGPQLVADRYSYFSCMPWALLVGGGWLLLRERLLAGKFPAPVPRAVDGLALAVLVVLGILTWNQTRIWRNSETLWRHAIALDNNSSFAHNNLGEALNRQGRLAEAEAAFRETLRINPDKDPDVPYNLGNALAKQGKLDEAAGYFYHALRIDPRHADAHYDLGNVLARQGNLEKAVVHFSEALRVKPGNARALYNLGQIYLRQDRKQEAIDHFRAAANIDPSHEKAVYYLAATLAARNDWNEAVQAFRAALRLAPNSGEAHMGLARALTAQGKREEAMVHYQEALRILRSLGKAGDVTSLEPR